MATKGKRANGARQAIQGRVMGRAIAVILGAAEPARRPFAGIGRAVATFWQELTRDVASPYRPEKHYMRGPGPAWQAKYGNLHGKLPAELG